MLVAKKWFDALTLFDQKGGHTNVYFPKVSLSLCTKVYLILGVYTKVYLQNLANLDADTKVYLE